VIIRAYGSSSEDLKPITIDSAVEIAKEKGTRVVLQKGKGRTGGIKTATELVKTPYILVMDADGTYNSKDIENFRGYREFKELLARQNT